jgi:DNA (cytosine-5)-methyltransferase 1
MGTGGNNVPAIAYEPTQDPAGTITTNKWRCDVNKATNGHLAVGPTVRRLTPTECERLQGFPDGWTTHRIDEKKGLVEQADSARYKQMGNAVAVPVVEWIFNRLVEQDNNEL